MLRDGPLWSRCFPHASSGPGRRTRVTNETAEAKAYLRDIRFSILEQNMQTRVKLMPRANTEIGRPGFYLRVPYTSSGRHGLEHPSLEQGDNLEVYLTVNRNTVIRIVL